MVSHVTGNSTVCLELWCLTSLATQFLSNWIKKISKNPWDSFTKSEMSSNRRNKQTTLIASFMGPTWGPSGADRTQVGPMLTPWTLVPPPPHQFMIGGWHVKHSWVSWGHLNIKRLCYQVKNSHYKDKTVSWLSYLYTGNLHTWKDGLYIETDPCL